MSQARAADDGAQAAQRRADTANTERQRQWPQRSSTPQRPYPDDTAGATPDGAAQARDQAARMHDNAASLHDEAVRLGIGDSDAHRRSAARHREAATSHRPAGRRMPDTDPDGPA